MYLVSCLYQLKSKIPYDFDLVKHGDERRCALLHLKVLKKGDIVVDDFHGKSERGVKQELFAHFALITMNRVCSNEADNQISKIFTPLNKNDENSPETKVNFKNCLTVVSRHLEEILLVPVNCVKNIMEHLLDSIARYRQKVRPNRSYVRKSMKPEKKLRPINLKKGLQLKPAK
jgi:hypothetical protein